MRRIVSALIIAGTCLCMQACDKPCPAGYAKAGVSCKPLPDAGELDGDASSGPMTDAGDETASKDAGDLGPGAVDGETCDGADNDNDGASDEAFVCAQAASTACTTTCGSSGMGTCTAQCERPSGSACVAPAEQCDGVDQDCDGIADNGFAYATLGYQVWTQTEFAADKPPEFAQVALIPRESGGAWFINRAAERGFDTEVMERDLRVGRLDPNGLYVDSPVTPTKPGGSIAWDGTTTWAADSFGKWIAILVRHLAPGNPSPSSTKKILLQLYDSTNFSFVAEIELASVVNDLDLFPQDVSVFEDAAGNVRAMAIYVLSEPSSTSKTYATRYAIATRTASGAFSSQTKVLLGQHLSAGRVAVARVPCRDEWLLGYAAKFDSVSYRDVRRVGLDGEFIGSAVDTLVDSQAIAGLSSGEPRCDVADPQMLVAYQVSDNTVRGRVWAVNRMTGAFSTVGSEVELGLLNVSAMQRGGRWFVAGVGPTFPHPASAAEINPAGASPSDRNKPIALFQSGAGADPGLLAGPYGAGFYTASRTAIVHMGSSIVLAFPNGFTNSNSNLDSLRSPALPNSTAPATAVTYRVGCP